MTVIDENDNDPIFPSGPYQVGISSEIYPTLDVTSVTVSVLYSTVLILCLYSIQSLEEVISF